MWNYRVIRRTKRNPIKNGKPKTLHFYDLHEVYYRKNGKPYMWTVDSERLQGFESIKDLTEALFMMLYDVQKHPCLKIRKVGKKEKLFVMGQK